MKQKHYVTSWIRSITSKADPARRRRGKEYFEDGRVKSLKIRKGKISAIVKITRDYKVSIKAPIFTAKENKIISKELSKILKSNDFPLKVEEELAFNDLSLIPKRIGYSCSCPDYERPCKHIIAVALASAEAFKENIRNYLLFRGFDAEKIFDIKDYIKDKEEIESEFTKIIKEISREYDASDLGELEKIYEKISKKINKLLKSLINKDN